MSPLAACVLIPTHDHAATLDLAVGSALEQTVEDIEVVVIGDGVGDDTREVMSSLCRADERVRFEDLPKGPNHGEIYRATVVEATDAPIVCYHCDDDLLFPDHVESMVGLLADVDLAQSLNGWLDPQGAWHAYLGDLALPECRWRLLGEPLWNCVSITGTAHTVEAYRRLALGWQTTPVGMEPDHFLARQFVAEPWFRGATSRRVTAVQFPSHMDERSSWPPEHRRDELEAWLERMAVPGARTAFDAEVTGVLSTQAALNWIWMESLYGQVGRLEGKLAKREEKKAASRARREATGPPD